MGALAECQYDAVSRTARWPKFMRAVFVQRYSLQGDRQAQVSALVSLPELPAP